MKKMRATGEREIALTFQMSEAEIDLWQTFAAELDLALADVLHLAALSGLKYQARAAGDQIKALVAERCEREALDFLCKPYQPGPGMASASQSLEDSEEQEEPGAR